MSQYIPRIIGTGQLQRNASNILKEVAKSDSESIVVTRNEPQVVIMSIQRYEELKALEDLEFIAHPQSSPKEVRKSFEQMHIYSKNFLDDLEDGLKKSSLYS